MKSLVVTILKEFLPSYNHPIEEVSAKVHFREINQNTLCNFCVGWWRAANLYWCSFWAINQVTLYGLAIGTVLHFPCWCTPITTITFPRAWEPPRIYLTPREVFLVGNWTCIDYYIIFCRPHFSEKENLIQFLKMKLNFGGNVYREQRIQPLHSEVWSICQTECYAWAMLCFTQSAPAAPLDVEIVCV